MWINRDADNHIVGFNHGLTSARIAVATGPRLKGRRHAQPMPTRLGVVETFSTSSRGALRAPPAVPLPAARLPLRADALRAGGRGTAGTSKHDHEAVEYVTSPAVAAA
jgi:hypothetical protein